MLVSKGSHEHREPKNVISYSVASAKHLYTNSKFMPRIVQKSTASIFSTIGLAYIDNSLAPSLFSGYSQLHWSWSYIHLCTLCDFPRGYTLLSYT